MIKDEDTAYEQARQERIDSPLLSDRLRPGVECAPWVIDEVRKLERERDAALQHEAEMANSVMLTGQVAFQAQEAAKDLAKQLDAANELIRAYREESTASARLYPYPVHLENPEFRLLFESAQLIQNVGEPDRANEVRKIAYRLQDEWLAGRA